MMMMYFDTMVTMTNILFKGWDTNSTKDMVLASFIALCATVLFEALKVVREVVTATRKQHPLGYSPLNATPFVVDDDALASADPRASPDRSESSTTDLLASLNFPADLGQVKRRRLCLFILESVLHMVLFFFGYLLMLLVMTYSVWFLGAVLIGSGLGYFLWHPLGHVLMHKLSALSVSSDLQAAGLGDNPRRRGRPREEGVMVNSSQEKQSLRLGQPMPSKTYSSMLQ